VLVFFVSIFYHFVPLAITGQLFLLLMLARALVCWPPMAAWLAAMPVAHRIVLGALLGAMVLGITR